MTNHSISIPGLDRFYCSNCGKWVCTEHELNRLNKLVENAGKKTKDELYIELTKEVALSKKCNLTTKVK